MEKHMLFMLTPWFENRQGPFYCPDCGVVEGFFVYSPEVRDKIEIISVAYQRPRQRVIEHLGAENQGCPVLVIADNIQIPEGAKKSLSTGRAFIDDSKLICEYLGKFFDSVKPHP